MIFERARQNRKAQTVKVIVMLVVGLVVVGMLIYLGYKYILGTGESVGALSSCEGQGGECKTKANCDKDANSRAFFGMGCPKVKDNPETYCCIPNRI